MSRQKLTLSEMHRISEAVPNIWDLASRHFGVTPERLKEMIEAGQVYFESPIDAAKAVSEFLIEQWSKER